MNVAFKAGRQAALDRWQHCEADLTAFVADGRPSAPAGVAADLWDAGYGSAVVEIWSRATADVPAELVRPLVTDGLSVDEYLAMEPQQRVAATMRWLEQRDAEAGADGP